MKVMRSFVQVKVCGLTRIDEAVAVAEAGADAIGCVFYPPSPRNVTPSQAAGIVSALPPRVTPVGVFVNQSMQEIVEIARESGIRTVQLHGEGDGVDISLLHDAQLRVVMTLKRPGERLLQDAAAVSGVDAFLVECGHGPLPGGNAAVWDWRGALPLSGKYPMALAGGLTPGTVEEAIAAVQPDAVDVSSAVECEPGRKDLEKVKAFITNVRRTGVNRQTNRVF